MLQCAVAVAASLLALAPCSSSPSVAIKPSAAPPGPSCAWPSVIGVQTSNRIIPDLAAAYWDQPITARPSTRVTISGTYPDARYLSLSVYTPYATPFTASGVSSSLPDYRISHLKPPRSRSSRAQPSVRCRRGRLVVIWAVDINRASAACTA
jgi:hypothetical protein